MSTKRKAAFLAMAKFGFQFSPFRVLFADGQEPDVLGKHVLKMDSLDRFEKFSSLGDPTTKKS